MIRSLAITRSVSPVEGSVVYFASAGTGIFAEFIFPEFMDTDAINSIYNFNPDRSPRGISILDAWRTAIGTHCKFQGSDQ